MTQSTRGTQSQYCASDRWKVYGEMNERDIADAQNRERSKRNDDDRGPML